MIKKFTKILGLLAAITTSFSTNAMEWRMVSNEDFGGNSESDPVIRTDAPHGDDADKEDGFFTPLKFSGILNPMAGIYMVIKSTDLATNEWDDKLTDCTGGGVCWTGFGDHTYSSNPNKGYFMIFDADRNMRDSHGDLVLYKKALDINCSGVNFRFNAWLASASSFGANHVRLSIQDNAGNDLTTPKQDNLNIKDIKPGVWKNMELSFKVDDPSINKVYFVVKAISVENSGYDLALDDITIEISQPEITIAASEYQYMQPATLTAKYNQSEFDSFFGGATDVEYHWYYKAPGAADNTYIEVKKGVFSKGTDISYQISAFEKEKHNGTYKLIVATSGNVNNNLCSIQKTFVIDENKNKLTVDICKDSTKVLYGHTLTSTTGYNDASIEITVNSINYTTLSPKYTPQCQNSSYPTVGDIELDPIIEKDANNGCPTTIQKHYLRVSNSIVTDEDKHICEGTTYKGNENVNKVYTEVNEKLGERIEFDYDNCRHEQYVYVHPKVATSPDVTVCAGDSYMGVPYNKKGSYKGTPTTLKTIWGCDSVVTPQITVVEPVIVDLGELTVCPSDNYTFAGKVYNYQFDDVLVDVRPGSNGCDSTTKIHLIVNEGGTVRKDTLICREQILFGKEYTIKGSYIDTTHGHTEANCPIDTIWNIQVVEITLKLRMWGNQDQVCEGQPSIFETRLEAYEPSGKKLTPTYHWEPEVPSNALSPTLYLSETTTYTIYADLDLPSDVDKNAKGCHATASQTITVNPLPELTIDSLNPDNRTVEYTITSGTMPYHMYLGTKNSRKDLGEVDGNYGTSDHIPYGTHKLQVQDSTGCSAEQEIVVEATQPEPAPFFSPNGDGENDVWKVKNLDVYPNSTIRIYDRFGKMLHSSSGEEFEFGWDGTYNGNKMPASDYWYEIDIEEIDTQYFGHFTLIR